MKRRFVRFRLEVANEFQKFQSLMKHFIELMSVKCVYRPEKSIKMISGVKTVISSFLTRDHLFPNSESPMERERVHGSQNHTIATLGSMAKGVWFQTGSHENYGGESWNHFFRTPGSRYVFWFPTLVLWFPT